MLLARRLFATLMVAGTVACTTAPAAADDQISFLVVDYDAPGMGDWWQLLVETYETATGVDVDPRNTPARSYYERLLLEATSGTGADVLTVNPNNLGEMLAAEQLTVLDDWIARDGIADLLVDGATDSLTVNGKTYAIPITGRTLQLIYNACLFEDSGIKAPPTTPQEFLDLAKRLVVKEDSGRVTRFGANMVNANEDPTYEMLLMWSIAHGGSFSDNQGNFTVDSQPVIDGLKFMKAVYDSGAIPQGMAETDLRALFATGGSAMTIDGQWQFPFIKTNNPDNYDCYKSAPQPWAGPATGGVNMALAVNANSENPDAAWNFIKTAVSTQMQSKFGDHSPFIPYGINAMTEEQLSERPYLRPWLDSIGSAHPIFIPGHEDDFNQTWPIIVDAILLTLREGVPAEESLAKAQKQLVECCAN